MFGKMSSYILPTVLASLILVLTGCSQDKQDQQTSEIERAKPPEVITIKGKVLEAVEAGSFLYVFLDLGEKQTWAAVPLVDIEIGEEVTLRNANYFNNFYSKSLQKSFDEMIFSTGIDGKKPKRRLVSVNSQGKRSQRRSMMLSSPTTAKPQSQANTDTDPAPAKAE
ncbi:MAG: hypothetical protein ABFQ82_05765 [Thermodesulfobacteriota bacterium]